jgi:hypothetical protein
MEELKSRIVSLNLTKNNYATKKMKGESTESDDKDLISSLIYVIAECRRVANDLGVGGDGMITREDLEMTIFTHLNRNVKDLKTQIVTLTQSSPDSLRALMRQQKDERHLAEDKEKSERVKGKDEKSRQIEMRDHLRSSLLAKEKKKDVKDGKEVKEGKDEDNNNEEKED